MPKWTALAINALFILLISGCSNLKTMLAPDINGYEARIFRSDSGKLLNYRLLKPDNLDNKLNYPLVIFLHGSGERGDDNKAQLIHGTWRFAEEGSRSKYPSFVVVPQCPEGKRWVEVDWSAPAHVTPEKPSESFILLLQLLREMQAVYPIDDSRIYVTGLSMGGYGTWDLIARYPELFAAAVPICGGGDSTQAKRIRDIPVWAFHGSDDNVVPPQRSEDMIEAMRKAGGQPRYTEYENVGHGSWAPAYEEIDLLDWLYSQKKQTKE